MNKFYLVEVESSLDGEIYKYSLWSSYEKAVAIFNQYIIDTIIDDIVDSEKSIESNNVFSTGVGTFTASNLSVYKSWNDTSFHLPEKSEDFIDTYELSYNTLIFRIRELELKE